MQWLNLEEELRKYFKFERNISPAYQERHNEFIHKVGVPYTNVVLRNQEFMLAGTAHHFHEDNEGVVIYEYSVDREIRKEGKQLPAPLEMLQDCERHYYGLKLSCLGYLSGKRIKSLILRDSYNGESISMPYKQYIVAKFLSSLTHSQVPASGKIQEKQASLFAA